MFPTPISPDDTTPALNRAAKVIVAFRAELTRYGVSQSDAQAIILSRLGDAIIRRELGLLSGDGSTAPAP